MTSERPFDQPWLASRQKDAIVLPPYKLEAKMRAVGYRKAGAVDATGALVDFELPRPEAKGRDILVAVKAVSVNPVDTKVRRGVEPAEGVV